MRVLLAQLMTRWTEDTALLDHLSGGARNRSADPGAKTGVEAKNHPLVSLFLQTTATGLRDWPQSEKPSRHDAATTPARCPSSSSNQQTLKFQFPLNQDTSTASTGPALIVSKR